MEGSAFTFRALSRPFAPVAIQTPADDPTDLLYSTFLGGSDFETSYKIALGADGSIYVTGATLSTDFPTTPGAFDTTCEINIYGYCGDAFITKVSGDGSALVYSTFLGGSIAGAGGEGIAVGRTARPTLSDSPRPPTFPSRLEPTIPPTMGVSTLSSSD